MSKRKKPTPPGFIAASKNPGAEVSRPVPPAVVKPRHRMRDEVSVVSPGEALKAARESRASSAARVETPEQARKQVAMNNARPVVPTVLKKQQLGVVSEPVRRSAATRYSQVKAVDFVESTVTPPKTVRKSMISEDLRNAILSDSPHPSEFVAQEVYDVDSPLPQLLASDFEDEGIPDFFVELTGEDGLVLPPVSVGEEPYGAAGVIHDDRVYDVELAGSESVESVDSVPVEVGSVVSYRESYLASVHAEEFFDELFVEESVVSGEPVLVFDGADVRGLAPVEVSPSVSVGRVVMNAGWWRLSSLYSLVPAVLVALVTVLITVFRSESWVIPLIVGGVGVLASAAWFVYRVSRFKKFVLDFDSGCVEVGGLSVPFADVWEGDVFVSERFGLFSLRGVRLRVGASEVKCLVSSSSWGLSVVEGDALVDFVHRSSLRRDGFGVVGEVGVRPASQEEVLGLVASTRMGLD